MSVHYHPFSDPRMEIDVRACLVEAVARAIERRCGGNPVLNRLEAEACADLFLSSNSFAFLENEDATAADAPQAAGDREIEHAAGRDRGEIGHGNTTLGQADEEHIHG